MTARCPDCFRRLRADVSQLAHTYSGECPAKPAARRIYVSAGVEGRARPQVAAKPRPEPAHGTRSRYTGSKYLCRCGLCTQAAVEYARGRKTTPRREPMHGTDSRYTSSKWRCRCDLCRTAHAVYERERSHR